MKNENIKDYLTIMNQMTKSMKEIKNEILNNQKITHKILVEPQIQKSKMISENLTNYVKINKKIVDNESKKLSIIIKKIKQENNDKIAIIKQIMKYNNGVITTRLIEPFNINRQYLSILEKNKEIERVNRGIYISSNTIQDDFFIFQQKYKKAIFSHMTALYFYGMTEELPYNFTIRVPKDYHVDTVNEKCNVFYSDNKVYELGISEVMTPNGNIVRAYDLEKSICDIIKSKNRMDFEQVKKVLRLYVKNKNKDIAKLSKYATEMKINDKVMEMVGMYYE